MSGLTTPLSRSAFNGAAFVLFSPFNDVVACVVTVVLLVAQPWK